MAEYTYGDLKNGTGPLAADSVLGQIVGGARDLACEVYRDFPKFALADPIGALAFSEAVWDAMCRTGPEDNFPSPTPLPPGGQCVGSLYRVTVATQQPSGPETLNFTVPGPVGGITTSGNQNGTINVFFTAGNGQNNVFTNASKDLWRNGQLAANITGITPEPGQPDNCGNGLPEFPPVLPPAEDLEKPVPVNPRGGPSFTIPLVYVRPTANFDLDLNLDVNIPVTIRGPLIGIDINFGPNGITINPSPGPARPWRPPADPRDPNAPGGPKTPERELLERNEKLSKEILEKLKKLLQCECPEEGTIRFFSNQPGSSGEIACPPRTFAVIVEVTRVPTPPKSQFGDGQPDVHFAGWGWFFTAGGLTQRLPIDSLEKCFLRVGPNPSSFKYTCTNAYQAKATVYYTVDP